MKVEVGESLMRSWLRHAMGCQLAELNWKPSSTWEKYGHNQDVMDRARAFFRGTLGIDVFKKTAKASQLIKQAEIDVLGVKLGLDGRIEAIYGADVAYHEAGLHYEDTVVRILKKLLRGRMAIQTYFGPIPCTMIFASPIVGKPSTDPLHAAIDSVRAFFGECQLETTTSLYVNDRFRDEILIPTLEASTETADSSELFLRSYRLIKKFRLAAPREFGDAQATARHPRNGKGPPSQPDASPSRDTDASDAASRDREPVSAEKIIGWAKDPSRKVHRILAVAVRREPLPREQLVAEIRRLGISRDPYGAVASLMTNGGKNYGLVFIEDGGLVRFHPGIEEVVRHQDWSPG